MSGQSEIRLFTCSKGAFKETTSPKYPYCNGCTNLEKRKKCPDFEPDEED